jgi:hypothetical protein
LPGAVRSEQRQAFAGVQAEAYVVHGATTAKRARQSFRHDDRRLRVSSGRSERQANHRGKKPARMDRREGKRLQASY